MDIERHVAYLDSEIAIGRTLSTGCALVAATSLALLRFHADALGSLGRLSGSGAVVLAGYGLLCGGVFGARLRGVLRALRRAHLQEQIGKGEEVRARDRLSRFMDAGNWDERSFSNRILSLFLGVYPSAVKHGGLTVERLAREVEGAETRALSALVFSIVAIAICLADVLGGPF